MNDDLDLLDNGVDTSFSGARPSFVTVLCILTFIGTGLGLIIGFFQFWMISTMGSVMYELQDTGSDMDQTFSNSYRWMKIALYAGFFGNIACLVGALLMWRLRKVGYFIYAGGQAVPLVVSILSYATVFGGSSLGGGLFGGLGLFGLFIGALFPIGFVIMYGLNYKYFK